jgi:hypothetical protein
LKITLNPSASIASSTTLNVIVQNLQMGYCRLPSASLTFSTSDSEGFEIERGSSSFDTSTLQVGQSTVTSALSSSNTLLGQATTLQVSFSVAAIIEAGSTVQIKIPDFQVYSASTCSLTSGVSYSITCGVVQDTPRYFKATFNEAVPANTVFTFSGTGVQSPKLAGQYSAQIVVISAQGCTFSTGTSSVSIAGISASSSFAVEASNTYLNSYSALSVKLTPSQPHWSPSDFVLIEAPYGLSSSVTCKPTASAIQSMACSAFNITTVKATLSVDDAAFQSDKVLSFVAYSILNPPQAGASNNFKSSICTSLADGSGLAVFEQASPASGLTFENYISLDSVSVEFDSNLRGYVDYTKFSASVNSILAQGSAIQLTYSQKFQNISQAALISSSPRMVLVKDQADSGILYLELQQEAAAGSSLLFTLSLANPVDALVSPGDLQIKLLQGSSRNPLATASPIKDSIRFVCDKNCQDCGQIYNICTKCSAGKNLEKGTCVAIVDKPPSQLQVRAESSIPFICLGVAVILAVTVLVWGLICRKRLYWGNMLYSLLRPIHTASLVLFLFFSYINDESYWVLIAGIVILAIHLALSITGTVFAFRALNKATIGSQNTDNRFLNALVNNYREKHKDEVKVPRWGLMAAKILSPVVSFGVFRWFFSSSKVSKGYFWHFDTPSFNFLKSVLQRFQMLYIFFVHIGVIIVVAVSLAQTIYLFKIETIVVSILDLLTYTVAYFELNPFKLRKSPTAQRSKEEVAKEAENYLKLKGKDGSVMPDNSELVDEAERLEKERKVPFRRSNEIEDENLINGKTEKTGPCDDKIKNSSLDPRANKGRGKEQGLEQPLSEDTTYNATGRSAITRFPIASGKDKVSYVPHYDPEIDRTLAKSTSNYGEAITDQDDRGYISQHKAFETLPSNLGQGHTNSTGKLSDISRWNGSMDIIYETHEGDDAGGNWKFIPIGLQDGRDMRRRMEHISEISTINNGKSKKKRIDLNLKETHKRRQIPQENVGATSCYQETPQLKDKKGRQLDLSKRTKNGGFILNNGKIVHLQYKSEASLESGSILDRHGIVRKLGDQDLDSLADEGKIYDSNGKVIEIFGQDPKDLESGLVTLDDGTTFNLKAQKDGLMKKGILVKTDGTCLNTKIPQDKHMLARGIILDHAGQQFRLIDQTAVALRASEIKAFGGARLGEPRAPKKPNKANFEFDDISEDDPFQPEPSKTQSSLLVVHGKTDNLKAGLFDSRFMRGKREVHGLADDDFSELKSIHNQGRNIFEVDSYGRKTATMDLSRGNSDPVETQAREQVVKEETPDVERNSSGNTNGKSPRYILESPHPVKVSNFITSSNILRQSDDRAPVPQKAPGEVHSEGGGKSEETIGGSLQEMSMKTGKLRESQLRMSRNLKRQSTDSRLLKDGQ